MDRGELGEFLRSRRALLQPSDVGMPAGARRRTPGLRRFEVAQLAAMSPDYLARLEQGRGAAPSVALVAALARALRLSHDERDHLFLLAGHHGPPAAGPDEHVSRALLRLLDDLATLPALIASDLNVVLTQNALADALLGEQTPQRGYARSCTYRWFTDPAFRARQPVDDHEDESRAQVEDLRATVAARRGDRFATGLVRALRAASPEFTRLWTGHGVAVRRSDRRRIIHPVVGLVELDFDVLATSQGQRLVIYSPAPGSEAVGKLELIAVLGRERFATADPHRAP
ncbi:helix-turn-helix domain-containing protein [Pseudonocardia sp. MH-G8]|uniref:MmyB family transcriptional regulator n=1 Tax=Pseudonocardia sp. MH-G8 TaxID=1854588 RepID=UPI000B9FD0BC|nr:helix-turn-helix domain-containing protein [Pseudonocardia sp. MH-G8]OZM75650.1 transcriptional regulator [Pseudonocardia sp. MH-G8]